MVDKKDVNNNVYLRAYYNHYNKYSTLDIREEIEEKFNKYDDSKLKYGLELLHNNDNKPKRDRNIYLINDIIEEIELLK